jgi:hypothetical protein
MTGKIKVDVQLKNQPGLSEPKIGPDAEPIIVMRTEPPTAGADPRHLSPEIQVHYEEWLTACRRIWEATKDPLIIHAAIRHVSFYQQPIEPWLAAAADEALVKGRTKAHIRRHRELSAQMQRWIEVKALRAQGMGWDEIRKTVTATVWNSYAQVQRDTCKGTRLDSRYWFLSDTTRRPHLG